MLYRHIETNGFYSDQAYGRAVSERGFKPGDFEPCNDDGSPVAGAPPGTDPGPAPVQGPDADSAPQWRDKRSGAYLSPRALENHLAWGHPADAFEACGHDGAPLHGAPVGDAPAKKKGK